MELKCSKCEQLKDCSEFSKQSSKKRGYSYVCKTCHNEYMRTKWYPQNSDKQIKSSAKWREENHLQYRATKHKVDLEKTKILFEEANGKCQICGVETTLCLDHCHQTNEVRGFLCSDCNLGLGKFKDNISFLENAIKYLERQK